MVPLVVDPSPALAHQWRQQIVVFCNFAWLLSPLANTAMRQYPFESCSGMRPISGVGHRQIVAACQSGASAEAVEHWVVLVLPLPRPVVGHLDRLVYSFQVYPCPVDRVLPCLVGAFRLASFLDRPFDQNHRVMVPIVHPPPDVGMVTEGAGSSPAQPDTSSARARPRSLPVHVSLSS